MNKDDLFFGLVILFIASIIAFTYYKSNESDNDARIKIEEYKSKQKALCLPDQQ